MQVAPFIAWSKTTNSTNLGPFQKLLSYEQRSSCYYSLSKPGTSNPNSLFKTQAGPVQLQLPQLLQPLLSTSRLVHEGHGFLFSSIWFNGFWLLFWEPSHLTLTKGKTGIVFPISLKHPTKSLECALYCAGVNQYCILWYYFCACEWTEGVRCLTAGLWIGMTLF